jgi:group II intron reverse transcriptase/maturase
LDIADLHKEKQPERERLEMNVNVGKTVPVSLKEVEDAYAVARQGGKAAGIDKESWKDFERNLEKNLYVVWNRLASGSYFPQPVRLKMIPKPDGKQRKLGIPTIRDRIAQQVLKARMEPPMERVFSNNSYGYRPGRNAHQALEAVTNANRRYDWVIDLDISKFFDEIDHELLMKAVDTVISEKWLKMYICRILQAPEEDEQGILRSREGRGTPQGGVISPLLANLFLHYAFDRWLERYHPQCSFVRYADDIVIHCRTLAEAQELMQAIKERMAAVKLRVNETKSKIAYCKDSWRTGTHEHNSYKFLGFQFQPRTFKSKSGKLLQSFKPAISIDNQTKIKESIRTTVYWHSTNQSIELIAELLNSKLRGWVGYFAELGRVEFKKTMGYLQEKLAAWMKRKYKITGTKLCWLRLKELMVVSPNLFYHWQKGYV